MSGNAYQRAEPRTPHETSEPINFTRSHPRKFHLTTVDDYEPWIGAAAVDRILGKAERLRDMHIVNISSTYYGGGVADLLTSLTLLMNSAGISTDWRVIQGRPDFFRVTKEMHNALHGAPIDLTPQKLDVYEEVAYENAVRLHLDHDLVIVHDPQPLPIICHYHKKAPWIWQCHVDLTNPNANLWRHLAGFIEHYDAVVLSLPQYVQNLTTPQRFFAPAINPFSTTSREMSAEEIDSRITRYGIPIDLPLVVQISRFDRWKDPQGVIEAFRLARREVDCTLVLLGNVATDDPEGQEVFASLCENADARVHILSVQDTVLVNALQRRAAVVLQKSLREGFGLTVAEAMWKGAAVIGGNAGGVRYQIEHGVNGFLVDSVEETAARIVQLIKDEALRRRLGQSARESVRRRFLMTRLMEDWLDLVGSFETVFRLRSSSC